MGLEINGKRALNWTKGGQGVSPAKNAVQRSPTTAQGRATGDAAHSGRTLIIQSHARIISPKEVNMMQHVKGMCVLCFGNYQNSYHILLIT